MTIKSRKGDVVVDADEYPKHGTTVECDGQTAAGVRQGRHGHGRQRSGINDGAAAVVLMKASEAQKRGRTPLARIVSWAHAGVDPAIMGTGPIPASRAALKKAGWKVDDLDLDRGQRGLRRAGLRGQQGPRLGYRARSTSTAARSRSAIRSALRAARVLVTLLHEMQKRNAKKGLATLCIGGGMGIAMCVER